MEEDHTVCEYARMKRTTVTLPDELAEEVAREARRRRTSVSAVVRDSLEKQLGCEPGKRKRYAIIGIADRLGAAGAPEDRDVEDVLREDWAAAITRHQES